jgi:hypothetical protein
MGWKSARRYRVMHSQITAAFDESPMAQVGKFDLNQGSAAAAANYAIRCFDSLLTAQIDHIFRCTVAMRSKERVEARQC